jgi:hypothetical protein
MIGSYHIIKGGDATKPSILRASSQMVIVPHICNDIGKWGSGFVIALDRAFGPLCGNLYRFWHREGEWSQDMARDAMANAYVLTVDKTFELGKTLFVDTERDNPRIIIANMIAQHDIVPAADGTPPIRYEALEACMKFVAVAAKVAPNLTEIHAPKFGSLRAGGDWDRIEKMIHELWVEKGLIVAVYEFEEKK